MNKALHIINSFVNANTPVLASFKKTQKALKDNNQDNNKILDAGIEKLEKEIKEVEDAILLITTNLK